ncbi:GTPBP3 [Cordylochernes scorpioides]|uniref:GTPBP3 n=1 Tax=Cordylochernes scorpioides TaxID=51811 RepID=A0ABY6KIM8_9ARAC|nr:GTPBP3 [Cordylochernes scorpioides]
MQMTREKAIPKPRVATQIKLFEPSSSTVLDHAITLWFPKKTDASCDTFSDLRSANMVWHISCTQYLPEVSSLKDDGGAAGPRSATGEDVCELHVHGGPAVISATLAALARLPDFALAEPGEFTRRENHTKMLCGEDPTCTFCNSKLKNEITHYIFDCPALKEERRTLMLKTGQLCASLPSIIDNMTQNKYIATAFYGFHKSISQKKAKWSIYIFFFLISPQSYQGIKLIELVDGVLLLFLIPLHEFHEFMLLELFYDKQRPLPKAENCAEYLVRKPCNHSVKAFLNGKLDLTEAEGLGDLIHADTEAQRQRALQLLGGKLSSVYQRWTDQLKLFEAVPNMEAFKEGVSLLVTTSSLPEQDLIRSCRGFTVSPNNFHYTTGQVQRVYSAYNKVGYSEIPHIANEIVCTKEKKGLNH